MSLFGREADQKEHVQVIRKEVKEEEMNKMQEEQEEQEKKEKGLNKINKMENGIKLKKEKKEKDMPAETFVICLLPTVEEMREYRNRLIGEREEKIKKLLEKVWGIKNIQENLREIKNLSEELWEIMNEEEKFRKIKNLREELWEIKNKEEKVREIRNLWEELWEIKNQGEELGVTGIFWKKIYEEDFTSVWQVSDTRKHVWSYLMEKLMILKNVLQSLYWKCPSMSYDKMEHALKMLCTKIDFTIQTFRDWNQLRIVLLSFHEIYVSEKQNQEKEKQNWEKEKQNREKRDEEYKGMDSSVRKKNIDVTNTQNLETGGLLFSFHQIDVTEKQNQEKDKQNWEKEKQNQEKRDEEYKEMQELDNLLRCKVCLDSDACVIFFPCRHMVTCEYCESFLEHCPVCRCFIEEAVKVSED